MTDIAIIQEKFNKCIFGIFTIEGIPLDKYENFRNFCKFETLRNKSI